jgi:hypothetical protein
LGSDARRKVARRLFEVTEEMFYADFFGFFGFDGGGDMDKCFGCCGAIVFDFFNGKVGVCGDSLGGVNRVDVDDDEDWVRNVIPEKSVD